MPITLTIGRVAKAANCKVQTIRYYEQIGLLDAPPRSAGNQRLYGPEDIERLSFIRHARALGFSLDDIRALLGLADSPDDNCAAADSIARRQLAQVEDKIARLQALAVELRHMVDHEGSGRIAECRVIETLGDHSKCVTDRH